MKISLRRRHALTVADGAFSHKIDYVLILKGIQIALLVQKKRQFCWMGGFCPLVELHREGSALAACTAGLFYMLGFYISDLTPKQKCSWDKSREGNMLLDLAISTQKYPKIVMQEFFLAGCGSLFLPCVNAWYPNKTPPLPSYRATPTLLEGNIVSLVRVGVGVLIFWQLLWCIWQKNILKQVFEGGLRHKMLSNTIQLFFLMEDPFKWPPQEVLMVQLSLARWKGAKDMDHAVF